MALDSRSKRASSVGILLPFVLAPVLPDGTIDQGDRQHIALSYSGINAAAQTELALLTIRVAALEAHNARWRWQG
jgi:hypothetical protein